MSFGRTFLLLNIKFTPKNDKGIDTLFFVWYNKIVKICM